MNNPSFKPYPNYKPSDVEWLGDVPTHWEVRRFKNIGKNFTNGTTAEQLQTGISDFPVSRIETISTGQIDYLKVGYLNESSVIKSFYLQPDDLLISHINSYERVGNSARYKGERALLHGMNLIRVTPLKVIVPNYLEYLLKSSLFIGSMQRACKPAINQVSVTTAAIKAIQFPLPPLAEQTAIVRYLDQADERIRRYISSRERLIELLEEYRQAVIHHAVTRGLDPDVRLKPSGVEWLGDVPAHWEVRKLKTLSTRVQNGSTPSTEEPSYYAKGGLPWYSPPSLDRSIVIGHPTRYLSDRAVEEGKARPITPPALAVSVIGNVGKCAIMLQPGATNQQITCFELITNLCNPHFVIMQFRFAEESLIASASSATIAILDSGVLKATKIAIPPLSEQTAIVAYVNKATADIDAAIDRARREIELLGEYRTRLIADVVTGKVDVREAVVDLSDDGDVSSLDF